MSYFCFALNLCWVILAATTGASIGLAQASYGERSNMNVRLPPAYTVCKGVDGSALILLYSQSVANPKYRANKGYYNVAGQAECQKRGMVYVGSDSGIYQHQSVFDMLLSVFTPDVRKVILKHCEFDNQYHEAFQPEIIYAGRNQYQARMGYTAGNGQGLRLKSGNVGKLPPIVTTPQAQPAIAPTPALDTQLEPSHWIYVPATPAKQASTGSETKAVVAPLAAH